MKVDQILSETLTGSVTRQSESPEVTREKQFRSWDLGSILSVPLRSRRLIIHYFISTLSYSLTDNSKLLKICPISLITSIKIHLAF